MTSVISLIKHYQKSIEKSADDEKRVLRCLDKLHQLGVTVQHLQETGVGRTVNALRREPNEVGDAARALVNKWKNMVAEEEDSSDSDDQPPEHRGRDSPEESDHDNVNQSREGGQVYQSDAETDNRCNNQDHRMENTDKQNKRHNNSKDVEPRSKRARLQNGETTDEEDEQKPEMSQLQIKTVKSDEYEDEYNSDHYISNGRIHHPAKIKEELIKSDKEIENQKPQYSKSCTSKYSIKIEPREEDSRSDNSHTSRTIKSETHQKCENNGDPKNNRHPEKESRRRKSESKCSPENHSDSEKIKRHDKHSHSSDKHKMSDKYKSSEKYKISTDKHKLSEKTSDKKVSKDKHKSSYEKHGSSRERDTHKNRESSSSHKEKSKESASNATHKEKNRSSESTSSDKRKHESILKERSKDSEGISGHRVKHEKRESSSSKEKSQSSEIISRSMHSEPSSSHSRKIKDEKKQSCGDNKHKSSDKVKVDGEKRSSDKSSSTKNKDDVPKKKVKVESVDGDDGIDCESGASFAEALGMVSPVKSKKKYQSKDSNISSPSNVPTTSNGFPVPASLLAPSTRLAPLPPLEISALPEISPHYKPRPPPRLLPHAGDEQALSFVMSNKNQRTKVFSGNKTYGKMSSLYDLCVAVLQEHIDALEYTGGVPYDILKPVVDRATPEQLFVLEHHNPYLMEDTNHLWQKHCERKFRNKQRLEMETWREMYLRCQEEQEARLKSLTANIKMAQEVRNAPTKQTKMAYVDSVVKPPRNIARKQAIHGTARAAVTSPAARVAALAGAGVVRAGTLPSRASASTLAAPVASAGAFKPKKAPLMQKALQLMRGRKR